jgi:hypothetical protein
MAASTNEDISSGERHMETENHFPDSDNVHDVEEDSACSQSRERGNYGLGPKIAAEGRTKKRTKTPTTFFVTVGR